MQISTRNFGTVEIADDKILTFPQGIIGFTQVRRYALVHTPDSEPYHWLQGVDDPQLAFLVAPIALIRPEYKLNLPASERTMMEFTAGEEPLLLAIVTIPASGTTEASINLLAPVMIHERRQYGWQIINEGQNYKTQHLLKDELTSAKEGESHAGAHPKKKSIANARR
jgi:flagellar assembly factor FliW